MKKILIVDDNRENNYLLEQFLAGNGMAVTTAQNGAEALEKAAAAPPDLIISDILMPVMDGYMLCRKLKSDKQLKHIPLIFYTASYTDPKNEAFALSLGAERFIIKPQDFKTLIKIINEVMEQKKEAKQEAKPEAKSPLGEEMEFFRQYNEILFIKLEKKISDVHQVNEQLQKEIAEHEKANRRIFESEEKYRLLVENSSEGIFIAQDGMFKFINRAAIKFFGSSYEVLTSNPFTDFIHPDDREMLISNHLRRLKGEAVPNMFTSRAIIADGTIRWVELHATIISWQGKPATLNFLTDITERQQAEFELKASLEALRQSEQQQRLITDNIQDMVWLMDMNMQITWVSPSATNMSGFSPEELTQISLGKLLTPESFELVQKLMLENLTKDNLANKNKEIIVNNEFGYYGKNGDLYWGEMSISLLRDAHGEPAGFLGVGRDITKRRQTEHALRETQKQLEDAYQLAEIGSWSWNIQDKSIIWSEELYRMTGLNNHAMCFSDAKHPQLYTRDSWQRLKEAVKNSLKTGESCQLEVEIIQPDGGNRYLNWLGGVIYDNAGKITGMHGTAQDITQRKKTQTELQKTNLELAAAYKDLSEKQAMIIQQEKMASIGVLAAGIAHEIKNPLAIILQGVNFLQTNVKDNSLLMEVVGRLNSAVLRADIIVKDLLSYARQTPLTLTKQNVPALIDESLSLTAHEFSKNNLQLMKKYAPDLPDICVDGNQIKQVFINLLLNGINAMSAGGTFTITAAKIVDDKGGNLLEIIFRDTGHGIPADKIDSIFDPFYTTKAVGNTGLGLSISRGIIDRHGGTISAESEVGQGTSMIIRLPIKL